MAFKSKSAAKKRFRLTGSGPSAAVAAVRRAWCMKLSREPSYWAQEARAASSVRRYLQARQGWAAASGHGRQPQGHPRARKDRVCDERRPPDAVQVDQVAVTAHGRTPNGPRGCRVARRHRLSDQGRHTRAPPLVRALSVIGEPAHCTALVAKRGGRRTGSGARHRPRRPCHPSIKGRAGEAQGKARGVDPRALYMYKNKHAGRKMAACQFMEPRHVAAPQLHGSLLLASSGSL